MSNKKYLDLITSQYKDKPKFTGMLTAFLKCLDDIDACGRTIRTAFDVDTAEGVQLDVLGQILGVNRTVDFQPSVDSATMTDDYYRICLKAKIAMNSWNGTRESLESALEQAFPESVFIVNDNQDMSFDVVYVTGNADTYLLELLQNGYIIPKPAGVYINYSTSADSVFGWELQNDAIDGWDAGTWI